MYPYLWDRTVDSSGKPGEFVRKLCELNKTVSLHEIPDHAQFPDSVITPSNTSKSQLAQVLAVVDNATYIAPVITRSARTRAVFIEEMRKMHQGRTWVMWLPRVHHSGIYSTQSVPRARAYVEDTILDALEKYPEIGKLGVLEILTEIYGEAEDYSRLYRQ